MSREINFCRHCGEEIEYHYHDSNYLHKYPKWGVHGGALTWHEPNYNNGYYCTEERVTSAEPLKVNMTKEVMLKIQLADSLLSDYKVGKIQGNNGSPHYGITRMLHPSIIKQMDDIIELEAGNESQH